MFRHIRYLAKLYLFWLLLFCFNRMVFLLVQHGELAGIPWRELLLSAWFALPLDSSAACYSCGLPFLLLWAAAALRGGEATPAGERRWLGVLRGIVLLSIFLHHATAYGEAALYTQWHTKLSAEALAHFAHPAEVFRSASAGLTLLFFGCLVLFTAAFGYAYTRWVQPRHLGAPLPGLRRVLAALVWFPLSGFVLFSGIRGGWKRFPISQSIAYFSAHAVLNDGAVNPGWNLIHNLTEQAKNLDTNPYHWMSGAEARALVDSLYRPPDDSGLQVLTMQRPNVVFIIAESWTSEALQVPGHPELMPVFDSLVHVGIYYDACYAAGHVSDQGLPAILSAMPSTGNVSICSEPARTLHLPALSESLGAAGYHTGFLYGGQLDFGNIQGYVYNKKFSLVRSGRELPSALPRTALGVPDAVMAGVAAAYINEAPEPYFYCWYTLSSHMPYDIPTVPWISFGGRQRPFANSMHYADSSLGIFLRQLRSSPRYARTLFVLVADHSHDTPYDRAVQDRRRHRIPLLFFGGAIRPEWRGRTLHRISSQLDIAATLLQQLGLPAGDYPWSRDLFNPGTPQFAAFNYGNGQGLVIPEGSLTLDDRFSAYLLTDLRDSARVRHLKRVNQALQQRAYDYFLQW